MSYERVIPRDLFNEASLLKCYGKLSILLSDGPYLASLVEEFEGPAEPFSVYMDEASGGIFLTNITLYVRGKRCGLYRPLNARSPWPLYLTSHEDDPDFDEIAVFNNHGGLSVDMLAFLGLKDN